MLLPASDTCWQRPSGLIGRLMRSVEARKWGGVVGGGESNPGQTWKGWDQCDHEPRDCVREYRQYDLLVNVMTENNDWADERFSVLLVEALTPASDSSRAEPPSDTCVWQTGNACLPACAVAQTALATADAAAARRLHFCKVRGIFVRSQKGCAVQLLSNALDRRNSVIVHTRSRRVWPCITLSHNLIIAFLLSYYLYTLLPFYYHITFILYYLLSNLLLTYDFCKTIITVHSYNTDNNTSYNSVHVNI